MWGLGLDWVGLCWFVSRVTLVVGIRVFVCLRVGVFMGVHLLEYDGCSSRADAKAQLSAGTLVVNSFALYLSVANTKRF